MLTIYHVQSHRWHRFASAIPIVGLTITLAIALTLLSALPAQAANYLFSSDAMPAQCTRSGATYTCSMLSFEAGATVTIGSPKQATIIVSGPFNAGAGVLFNDAGGASSDLNLVLRSDLVLGANAILNASVRSEGGGTVSIGAGSHVGNITSGTGVVTLGANVTVGGAITTGAGAVNIGAGSSVGPITTAAGVVTLAGAVRVSGDITTDAGAINIGAGSVIDGINSRAGVVTLNEAVQVDGGIASGDGAVTIGAGSYVNASITTGAGVVTLIGAVHVGGSVTTGAGAITIGTGSTICGPASSNGGGAVTNASAGTTTLMCSIYPPCTLENFSSGTLNPALWNARYSAGGYTPAVIDVAGQQRIRMTNTGANQSTMLQLKKLFLGAGNKIIVEFDHYAYGGSGADGVAVVFSDASVTPAPGGFGGSLGYAQRNDAKNGFGGGWLAVGIDEGGNFPNPSEGRSGYPAGWSAPPSANAAAGAHKNNVSVRGSASGAYPLLANTGSLSAPIWQASHLWRTRQRFRITFDNTDSLHARVMVERDLSGTGGYYATVIPSFDVMAAGAAQQAVPARMLVSFTGATSNAGNIHELAALRICTPSGSDSGGAAISGAFDCLESDANLPWDATARKPLYTKLVNTDFKFDIVALQSDGALKSNYVRADGDAKYAKVELFDAGTMTMDNATPAICLAYATPLAASTVAFAVPTALDAAADSTLASRTRSANFKTSMAYKNLICRVRECTDSLCSSFTAMAPACSSDQFSVRPSSATLATDAVGAPPSATATPTVKAGANFQFAAGTDAGTSYAGILTLDRSKMTAQLASAGISQQGGVVGLLTPPSLIANGVATDATYDEVGYLYLEAGAYRDDAFPTQDIVNGDCLINSQSNILLNGKYGCSIGSQGPVSLGRFIAHHFTTAIDADIALAGVPMPCPIGLTCPAAGFVYSAQPFGLTVTARNLAGTTTKNYTAHLAREITLEAWDAPGSSALQDPPAYPAGSDLAYAATAFIDGVASATPSYTFPAASIAPPGPTVIHLRARESAGDGVTSKQGDASIEGGISVIKGRLLIANHYGSEMLASPVNIVAQYWNGTSFMTSATDDASNFTVGDVTLSDCKQTLIDANNPAPLPNANGHRLNCADKVALTPDTPATFTLVEGATSFKLKAPGIGNHGSVDVSIDAPAWLSGYPARMTFGMDRGGPVLYLRELY
jgi:MSHA biogenesis protein MshQ